MANIDYSESHRPVSDLFSHTCTAAELDAFKLSDDQVEFFNEQGYVSGIRIFDDNQLSVLRDELAEFFQPKHDGQEYWYEYSANEANDPNVVLFHALGSWRLRPGFHDILWNPRFTIAASQLLGGAVRFWHDQLFCKPAKHGGVVAWHQDYSYWQRTKPMAHLTCWTGLDDSTTENGCLHYIPKSHLWDLTPVTGLAGDMDSIKKVLAPDQWDQFQEPVAIELKAGECCFHHPLMMHGSFANRSDRPRRAVVLNVVRDGVCSASNEPLLEGTSVIKDGQPLGGQFFPLLFDPTNLPK